MTDHSTIEWDSDADGVVILTLDDPTQRANTMTPGYRRSMHDAVRKLHEHKDHLAGVIITSAKPTFFAGGDLTLLSQVTDETATQFAAEVEAIKADLRSLETIGLPVVAALNGAALGGGLEIALACHHRIALDTPKSQFGLPEVTLGLMPGGGGVVRVTRLLGVVDALTKVLLEGGRSTPAEALEVGLVDELASSQEELMAMAKSWIAAHPASVQRWDVPGYQIPGGTPTSGPLAGIVATLPATLRKKLKGTNMPAPHHILCAAVEGAAVDMDTALKIEGSYFVDLARGQVSKNMIKAFWFDMNAISAGGSRPAGHEPHQTTKVAVLGAGMMGAGIAYVSARNGIGVVLKDVSIEAAERGKNYSRRLLQKAVSRGRLTQQVADATLAHIVPTDEYADLAGCDLVVEAVFENPALKHDVMGRAESAVAPDALLGSNTSTLPITGLADGVHRTSDFIGLHFFSPVDKMPLIEIIRGEATSDAALARALDYAAQICKTPIVVNDSRGFFTSRVISTFVNEALAMVGEGIHPATIEQAATQAGYPVGALQLADELNLELLLKVRNENRTANEAAGGQHPRHPSEDVLEQMIRAGRAGRLGGTGFFDYGATGRRLRLWPGLADMFPRRGDPAQVDLSELQERMLIVEAVDSARCLEEGVLTTAADANIGSIIGIGFPAWTGGVLQYINGFHGSTGDGMQAFVARADELADNYGSRFRPSAWLRERAGRTELF